MRTKLVKRYYCDFCSRGSLTKQSMTDHEARCFKNPARRCSTCELGVELSNLITAFAIGLPELRDKAENCPACMLSAILQSPHSEDFDRWAEFDYKKEKAAYDAERHAERWEGVGF